MKTWEMIQKSVQGDIWYSDVLGYPIIHTQRGFVPLHGNNAIKASNTFLRANDWKKISQ